MNTTRVQLPNGDLMSIEGGDTAQIANIITNALIRNLPAEQPMGMQGINFRTTVYPEVVKPEGETPLTMPVMNFQR